MSRRFCSGPMARWSRPHRDHARRISEGGCKEARSIWLQAALRDLPTVSPKQGEYGEEFGELRLEAELRASRGKSASQLVSQSSKPCPASAASLSDDITVVASEL